MQHNQYNVQPAEQLGWRFVTKVSSSFIKEVPQTSLLEPVSFGHPDNVQTDMCRYADFKPVSGCMGSYGGLFVSGTTYAKLFNATLSREHRAAVEGKIRAFLDSKVIDKHNVTSFARTDTGTLIANCGYYVNKYSNDHTGRVAAVVDGALAALSVLQGAGWVHGDIKLKNIVHTGESQLSVHLIDVEDPFKVPDLGNLWETQLSSKLIMFSPLTMSPLYIFYRQTANHALLQIPLFKRYVLFHNLIYLNCCQNAIVCKSFGEKLNGILDTLIRKTQSQHTSYMEWVEYVLGQPQLLRHYLVHSDTFSLGMSCLVEDYFDQDKSNYKKGMRLLEGYFKGPATGGGVTMIRPLSAMTMPSSAMPRASGATILPPSAMPRANGATMRPPSAMPSSTKTRMPPSAMTRVTGTAMGPPSTTTTTTTTTTTRHSVSTRGLISSDHNTNSMPVDFNTFIDTFKHARAHAEVKPNGMTVYTVHGVRVLFSPTFFIKQ